MGHKTDDTSISRYISLILRHKPEAAGITLDAHGWADTKKLIKAVKEEVGDFNMERLEHIVETDDKQRYAFDEHKMRIRANQGHSVDVDVEPEEIVPDITLYHGTSSRFEKAIDEEGLKRMSRNFVQLSPDIEIAKTVGKRHGGKLVIYTIGVDEMLKDHYKFYKSVNGVYLTKEVPAKYLHKLSFVE